MKNKYTKGGENGLKNGLIGQKSTQKSQKFCALPKLLIKPIKSRLCTPFSVRLLPVCKMYMCMGFYAPITSLVLNLYENV